MVQKINNVITELKKRVSNKPITVIDFNDDDANRIIDYCNGVNKFSIAKRHDELRNVKSPSMCLAKMEGHNGLYLGIIVRTSAVSTLDTRISIEKMCLINVKSFSELSNKITDKRQQNNFNRRISQAGGVSVLSSKLSEAIIDILASDKSNEKHLCKLHAHLFKAKTIHPIMQIQGNAVRTALEIFGVKKDAIPESVIAINNGDSCFIHLYEDNVITKDANDIPGFDRIESTYTGKAVFTNQEDRLIVFTANRFPLEEALGVDLIYVNDTKGNIVMVQYKMLEQENINGSSDWIFRPNGQFDEEMRKMFIHHSKLDIDDYRMCNNPFFFKFVKRKRDEIDTTSSIHLSLAHLQHLLNTPECRGSRDGIRISYNSLQGQYLREGGLIKLIQAGYVGTHRAESELLLPIIEEIAKGNRDIVVAWQQRLPENNKEGGNFCEEETD